MRLPRFVALLLTGALALTVFAAPAAAHPKVDVDSLPAQIDLPDGFRPEGITSWGPWLYAGSVANGAIWRGNAKTGEWEILVPGTEGGAATGLHIDRRGRLWVAGAGTGTVKVYDARSGEPLETYTFEGTGFLNDLDIVRNAVYVTDSVNQQLAVIPLRAFGRLPDPSRAFLMPLTGDLEYTAGFNANGLARSAGSLILVQSNTGFLFKVNPRTGNTTRIDTGGYLVTAGDGLHIVGRRLYVVRNQLNMVAVLRLSGDRTRARLIGEITAAPGVLSVPTTATVTLGALWVVNARFGVPPEADTPYWITRLPLLPS